MNAKLEASIYNRFSDQGDFQVYSIEILVFASPTGYMLTSANFPFLNWVYSVHSSKMIGNFPAVLNYNRLFLKLQPVHL